MLAYPGWLEEITENPRSTMGKKRYLISGMAGGRNREVGIMSLRLDGDFVTSFANRLEHALPVYSAKPVERTPRYLGLPVLS